MSRLGRLIKINREAKGLTQRDLSLYCEFTSPQYISNIEGGKSPASPEVINKLAKKLRLKKASLVDAAIEDWAEKFRVRCG